MDQASVDIGIALALEVTPNRKTGASGRRNGILLQGLQ